MAASIVCWKCGAEISNLLLPIGRYTQCSTCKADLHICIACQNYNPKMISKCDHPSGEVTQDLKLANYCEYFSPQANAYNSAQSTANDDARGRLEALFNRDSKDK